MNAPGVAGNDLARWRILERLRLLGTDADPAFDRLTRIAAVSVDTPIALLTFLGPDRQWIASRVGFGRTTTPLQESFCVCALGDSELLEVPDAALDARFKANPLVTGPESIRFYAGHPVVFEGVVLGTLCVLDRAPRQLTPQDRAVLADLAAMVNDLLRSRHDQAQLRASEERYRLLWQTTTDVVLMLNDANRIEFANPALAAVFGHAPAEVIGCELDMLQPPRLREGHKRGFNRYMASGVRRLDWHSVETLALHRDGHEFPVEISFTHMKIDGQQVFAACMRDISARRRQLLALQQSEARFRALTALSADWYWEQDANFRFTHVAGGATLSARVDFPSFIGKTFWDLAEVEIESQPWPLHRERLARHAPFRDVEIRQPGIGGELLHMTISGEPMFDGASQAFIGYRGVGQDITEQVRVQAARRELAAQLRESQKMEAIGVLAGGIAHDFNNVLAGILGNAALGVQDLAADHPPAANLRQIQKAGLRGRDLVQQILAFARRQTQTLTQCALNDLVQESMAMLRATLPAGVSLDLQLPKPSLQVLGDATQIVQVLLNLCTNAWHALDGQPGRIRVGIDAQPVSPSTLAAGQYAHLCVTDDGRGMDAATQARVFEPFFTTKAPGQGTGLGLSVVHGIVSAHGGGIEVQSRLGAGSAFHVYLPVFAARAALAQDDKPTVTPARGEGQCVMVIDDDEVMVVMVEQLLQRMGYRVAAFQNAEEALALLRQAPAQFDALVTDFNMPALSGLDVALQAAALRPDLPVVISSGNIPETLHAQARQAGVRALILKQHTFEELPRLLELVLRR